MKKKSKAKKENEAKKESKTPGPAKVVPEESKNIPPQDDDEKPFDFGGLPDRDLKKNLGCG